MLSESPLNLGFEKFSAIVEEMGFASYRARQIWKWIFCRFVFRFELMTDLPESMRETLAKKFPVVIPPPLNCEKSEDGVVKLTIMLSDGNRIESAAIPEVDGSTYCLSTQAGCPVKCAFCRTGSQGFHRNLTSNEILIQIMSLIEVSGSKPAGIVFMGMGEPFMNREALFESIDVITDRKGLAMGSRRITISTVGIVDGIDELAKRPGEVNLAVSLHTVNSDMREKLVPVAKKYPLSLLRDSVVRYTSLTGRRVTFEVVLLKDVNDFESDAFNLVEFCRGLLCHVNLIRFNPYPGSQFKPSIQQRVKDYQKILKKAGVTVTLRQSRGASVLAACGQLAGN